MKLGTFALCLALVLFGTGCPNKNDAAVFRAFTEGFSNSHQRNMEKREEKRAQPAGGNCRVVGNTLYCDDGSMCRVSGNSVYCY